MHSSSSHCNTVVISLISPQFWNLGLVYWRRLTQTTYLYSVNNKVLCKYVWYFLLCETVCDLMGHIQIILEQAVKNKTGYQRKTTTVKLHYTVKYNFRDPLLAV